MTEEQMQKCLQESLEQEDFRQLKFPFIMNQKGYDRHLASSLIPRLKIDSKLLYQQDFLTHKINQAKDQ